MFANTAVFDATGHPALTVPCGLSEGLPVGLMLVGQALRRGGDLPRGHTPTSSPSTGSTL